MDTSVFVRSQTWVFGLGTGYTIVIAVVHKVWTNLRLNYSGLGTILTHPVPELAYLILAWVPVHLLQVLCKHTLEDLC